VNPGNSGGPLFNTKGEVVGINAQIFSHSGAYEGLSFAIPIDIATSVQKQIVASGHVTRGHLGVTVQEVTQALANSFGLKRPEGALVGSVEPDGPAAKGGLRSGDVILSFNGVPITSSAQLPLQVAQLKPGTLATMQVWRHGATKKLDVTMGTLSDESVAEAGPATSEHGALGLVVRPLTPDERQQSGDSTGLLVERASGAAAAAGIEQGDIIVAMNGTPVKSAAQLRELVRHADKHVALLVQRNDAKLYVPLDLG